MSLDCEIEYSLMPTKRLYHWTVRVLCQCLFLEVQRYKNCSFCIYIYMYIYIIYILYIICIKNSLYKNIKNIKNISFCVLSLYIYVLTCIYIPVYPLCFTLQ